MSSGDLKVLGCFFMPQMRTICAVLDLNEIKYESTDVNVFKLNKRNQNFEYGGYSVPTLNVGAQTIIADGPTLYKYICLQKNLVNQFNISVLIEENFYPRKKMNADKKRIIDNFLDYVELMVRRNSSRLTKLVIQKLIHEAQRKNGYTDDQIEEHHNEMTFFNPDQNQEFIMEEQSVFFDIILANLEKQIAGFNNVQESAAVSDRACTNVLRALKEGGSFQSPYQTLPNVYITGQEYSIADIAMFNEIQNVFGILNLEAQDDQYLNHVKVAIKLKYPCVTSWMTNLENLPVIRQYQIQFEKAYLQDIKDIVQ